MIQQRGVLLVALKSLLITEIFIPRWRIVPSPASSMPTPFQSTMPQVIKIEDEGNSAPFSQEPSEQELMDMFRKGVQRRLELRKKQGQYNTSGTSSANPPPVQQLPPPPPHPPSPSPPAAPTWAKRLPTGPPPGLAGVRQPPQKQHQRKPPWQRAPQPPQPQQNAHRIPGPLSGPPPQPVNMQAAQRPPPPPANAHCSGGLSGPPPGINALSVVPPSSSGALPLVPVSSSAGAAKPPHAASKKKPTVPCGVCGVLCMTTWHLKDHERGRKHRNKLACLAGQMSVQCEVCNVHLSGALNVEQHYAGKQHRWRLNGGA